MERGEKAPNIEKLANIISLLSSLNFSEDHKLEQLSSSSKLFVYKSAKVIFTNAFFRSQSKKFFFQLKQLLCNMLWDKVIIS
jgi:hypothetical protein